MPGAVIHYTTDGTTPTPASSVYSGPILVSASETLEALAVASGYAKSPMASASFTITPPAAAPVISPAGGTFPSAQTVTISDATPGAAIYFTTNGATPTTGSSTYRGPIPISASETIRAIAAATGRAQSAEASASFTITPPAAAPVISPAGGTFSIGADGDDFRRDAGRGHLLHDRWNDSHHRLQRVRRGHQRRFFGNDRGRGGGQRVLDRPRRDRQLHHFSPGEPGSHRDRPVTSLREGGQYRLRAGSLRNGICPGLYCLFGIPPRWRRNM